MTRRVSFSAGHRYWLNGLTQDENHRLFGPTASPFNHGHNYVLDVTVEGPIDPGTGMVLNIKRIDELLRARVLAQVDGKSLNDELAEFRERTPTLENMLIWIRKVLSSDEALPDHVKLRRVRLAETELLFAELEIGRDSSESTMTLTRTYEFAASHRLDVPSLGPEENWELFGKCNNPAGHGHNYVLEVTVEGKPDPRTGMLVNLEQLDAKVNELVVDRYDHRNLNVDIPELRGSVPTSEVVAQKIFEALDGKLPAKLFRVRLHETARNMFEISSDC